MNDDNPQEGSPILADERCGSVTQPPKNVEGASRLEISKGIEDAYLLLQHATARGLEYKDTVLSTIVKARYAFERGTWTPETEIEFWNALRDLSSTVMPTTVESLRALDPTFGKNNKRFIFFGPEVSSSESERSIWSFGVVTLITMVLLLGFQTYWTVGNNCLGYLADLEKQIVKADSVEQAVLLPQKVAFLQFLQDVVVFEDFLLKDVSGPARADAMTYVAPKVLQNELTFIALFVLPILYGLLGACAYVMRKLSNDIATVSYTRDEVLQYKLRLLLGTLSGLSAAWFLKVDPTAVTAVESSGVSLQFLDAVAPWALAFLAGYSVELLFAALDKIVSAFTGK